MNVPMVTPPFGASRVGIAAPANANVQLATMLIILCRFIINPQGEVINIYSRGQVGNLHGAARSKGRCIIEDVDHRLDTWGRRRQVFAFLHCGVHVGPAPSICSTRSLVLESERVPNPSFSSEDGRTIYIALIAEEPPRS